MSEPRTCSLSTTQLIDIVMQFVVIYNEPAGIQLYSYQRVFMRRIIQSVLDREGAVISGLWSRQSGKSEALSSLSVALCVILPALCKQFPDDPRIGAYKEGFWIGIFAPKLLQSGIIYERIRKRAERESSLQIYRDPDFGIAVTQSRGDQVSWNNGSFVAAQTASEQSNVEGKTYHLVIIDEAQLVGKAKINKEISPMLAATNGTMVKIGTANALRGGFRETILYNLAMEKAGKKKNHFEFPYNIVIAEKRRAWQETGNQLHLNYERWVKGELQRLGNNVDNLEFRMNFRLLWQEENVGAIDKESMVNAADFDLEAGLPDYGHRLVAGLDYGRKRDVTVLTIMQVFDDEPIYDKRAQPMPGAENDQGVYYMKRIVAWYEIPGRKWNDILKLAAEAISNFAVDTIACDATGVGDPLTEQLEGLLPGVTIIPYMMSHVGNDRVFKLYIQEIEAGRLRYASGPQTMKTMEYQSFIHEHDMLQRDRVGVFTRCEAPEGEHDDYCDSAALCCWAASVPRTSEAEITSNPFYTQRKKTGTDGDYGTVGRSGRYTRRYR